MILRGVDHPNWKGDEVSYAMLHAWMTTNYPKTGRCEYCGCTNRKTEYASASHNRYTRNRADWFEFCKPCHANFDGVGLKLRGKTRPPEVGRKISAGLTGKVPSAETRERMSIAQKARFARERSQE